VKAKKNPKTSFKEIFDKPELAPQPPSRPRMVNFYSSRCYATRIKARFDAKWAVLSKQRNPPAVITVQNLVIKEAWDQETDAFKAEMQSTMENEHKAAMAAYETAISGEVPTSPEEFQM
jgi:hypothetical protein